MTTDQGPPDLILYNARVLTVAPIGNIQQAIAIRGELIQAVGSDEEVRPLAGSMTTSVDLEGRTVIPGIIDIHAHMDREGLKRTVPSLEGATSIDQILAIVKQLVAEKQPGEWVVTMPVGDPPNYADVPESLQEGRYPNRWELDRVSPNNPVYLRGIWTPWNVPPSVAVANSLALQLAGIDRDTPSPDTSVTIDRDAGGEPTGILIDSARFPSLEFTLMKVVPRFTHSGRVEALKESMRLYNSVGTTGTYEGHGVAPEVLQAYKELWDRGEMTVRSRLVLSPTWSSVAEAEREMELWAHSASGAGFGDDMLRIGGYYIQYGGSRYTARARGAELPFTGWAGFAQAYNPPSRFRRLVALAAKHNLRVNTIVRDNVDEVLQVFEDVHEKIPIDQRRWVLTHVRETSSRQLRRMAEMGLVIETIPLTELWLRGHNYVEEPDRAGRAVAHRSYSGHGVHYGLGTDNKPYNPFFTLWAAVARKERHTGKVLGPEQCLNRLEALHAFTMGGAYYSFEEDRRGSLEPGKLADVVVLTGDLLNMPEDEIPELKSFMTLVGGRSMPLSPDP
ncbi:MAG: amidohydrolase [Chloroflexi bacterium]|nr:amidohydrolase [Chloroflexota bacterium]